MNRRPDLPQVLLPVNLARESDFMLGAQRICPSRRQVIVGGEQETVQPRVMQVLVALTRAKGAVLSREELIESCWEGITVGDDAINRCIAKVRQIAHLAGGQAFDIQTIPRVGYRLTTTETKLVQPTPEPLGKESAPEIDPVAAAITAAARGWKWGLAASVALLAGLTGAWLLWPVSPARWVVVSSEVPIATSLIARHPSISPDGSMIAYSAGTNIVSRQIYLRHIPGGEALRLTNDAYDDVSPTWSPDGSRIAYIGYKQGQRCRLMVMPTLAGAPRELSRCQTDERSHVVWSTSGRDVFYLDRPNSQSIDRIVRLNVTSGHRTDLTHPPPGSEGDTEPSVSPDGRWMTFTRKLGDYAAQRILFDLRDGSERVLTAVRGDPGSTAAWAEDSETFFAQTGNGRDFALWAYSITGRADRILSSPTELGRLSSGPHGLLAVEIATFNIGLAKASAAKGTSPDFLTSERGVYNTPDLDPRGTLVVEADLAGDHGIWISPKDGSMRKLIDLPDRDESEGEPRWSPDGSHIAVDTKIAGTEAIRVVSATGADVARIPFRGTEIRSPAWNTEGTAVTFPGHDASGWRLWRVQLAHPDRLERLPYSGWLYIRSWKDALYGVRYDVPGVWRIQAIPRRITPVPSPDHGNQWTVAGGEIAYVDDPFARHPQILARRVEGGPARVVAQVPNYCWWNGFAIDPETGLVIYTATISQNSDIELLHLAKR